VRGDKIVIYLLTHPGHDTIGAYMPAHRWADLAHLADYIQHDVPRGLAHTGPERYRTLRAAVTDAICCGWGALNPVVLRRLARQSKPRPIAVPRPP
jgi:1,6-anhydro-N-acetylmuramate kinase